jgi:Family of unknown function (DUF6879)
MQAGDYPSVMTSVSNVISFEQFVRDFDGLFTRCVFRLEALDWYDAPNEHEPYARFLAGEPTDWAWREPWKRIVRQHRASGRIMQRVHVVSEPVSDYIRFELLRVYPANVEAGEEVRILSRAIAERLSMDLGLDGDFWLFDRALAARLIYDASGGVSRVEMERDPGEILWLAYMRDLALFYSIPLAQYVAEHNITERKQAA